MNHQLAIDAQRRLEELDDRITERTANALTGNHNYVLLDMADVPHIRQVIWFIKDKIGVKNGL